ncbi:MAG: cupin domain-containing protein [Opitutales bacterium]
MKAEIISVDESLEYMTEERCSILELSNHPDDPAVSIAQARVKPGVTTTWHALEDVAERYVILSGKGQVEIGQLEPEIVGPGDTVRIPPGVRQRISNCGREELTFLAICTPRFTPECYLDLESCD